MNSRSGTGFTGLKLPIVQIIQSGKQATRYRVEHEIKRGWKVVSTASAPSCAAPAGGLSKDRQTAESAHHRLAACLLPTVASHRYSHHASHFRLSRSIRMRDVSSGSFGLETIIKIVKGIEHHFAEGDGTNEKPVLRVVRAEGLHNYEASSIYSFEAVTTSHSAAMLRTDFVWAHTTLQHMDSKWFNPFEQDITFPSNLVEWHASTSGRELRAISQNFKTSPILETTS